MNETTAAGCPVHGQVDRRKSARIAIENTAPDEGARWVKTASVARRVLRSPMARQAGAGADLMQQGNPAHTSVFFLDGEEHSHKRRQVHRFLSPKTVSEQHFQVMTDITQQLLQEFQQTGRARLEDLSFKLAIEVVGEILGLTNSDEAERARRIQKVLSASISQTRPGLAGVFMNVKRAVYAYHFFIRDVRPAMKARKKSPRNDAISFFLEENYPTKAIIIECLTYGTAGMLTTREFILMVAWYLFEDSVLRERFLAGDVNDQLAILMEILRLEPVAAMVHRRVDEVVEDADGATIPPGELYGIDIRAANVDEEMVGECPFAVDPDRAQRVGNVGRYLSFSDGPHSCPGAQVALHETRIFLDALFRIPGLKLEREPDISWNAQLKSYELRNVVVSCETQTSSRDA